MTPSQFETWVEVQNFCYLGLTFLNMYLVPYGIRSSTLYLQAYFYIFVKVEVFSNLKDVTAVV